MVGSHFIEVAHQARWLCVAAKGLRVLSLLEGLLEGDEAGRLGGTNTGGTVLHRLVGDGELTEVVSDHVSLDLDLVENLAVVHTDNRADHLREDDHVAQVSLHTLWLLASSCV